MSAGAAVIDASGALKVGGLPEPSADSGVYVVVTSPGTPSSLLTQEASAPICTVDGCLVCRGATLTGTSEAERVSLGTCSLVASAIVVDGVTVGDLQAGLADSRHGRTLTALFRARTQLLEGPSSKQTLILAVHGNEEPLDKDSIVNEVKTLFQAVAMEKQGSPSFEDTYEIHVTSGEDKDKVSLIAAVSKPKLQTISTTHLVALLLDTFLGFVSGQSCFSRVSFVCIYRVIQ